MRGPAGVARLAGMMRGGLSDIGFDTGDVVGKGDKVLVRLGVRGRRTGASMGTAPTDAWVDMDVMDRFRIAGGTPVGHRASMDKLPLLRQVGAVRR